MISEWNIGGWVVGVSIFVCFVCIRASERKDGIPVDVRWFPSIRGRGKFLFLLFHSSLFLGFVWGLVSVCDYISGSRLGLGNMDGLFGCCK